MDTLSIDDVANVMKEKVVLARSIDARTKKAKDLKFLPWDLTYHVRYIDNGKVQEKTFREVAKAIDQYNAYGD